MHDACVCLWHGASQTRRYKQFPIDHTHLIQLIPSQDIQRQTCVVLCLVHVGWLLPKGQPVNEPRSQMAVWLPNWLTCSSHDLQMLERWSWSWVLYRDREASFTSRTVLRTCEYVRAAGQLKRTHFTYTASNHKHTTSESLSTETCLCHVQASHTKRWRCSSSTRYDIRAWRRPVNRTNSHLSFRFSQRSTNSVGLRGGVFTSQIPRGPAWLTYFCRQEILGDK